MMKHEVCIVGDAFVDILVPAGNKIVGGVSSANISIRCGGTANVAVWLSRLGERTSFFGKIGSDLMGDFFKNDLKRESVIDLSVIDKNNPTGICITLVDETGERTMITARGANDFIEENDTINLVCDIDKSKIAFFTGYSFVSGKTARSIKNLIKEVCDKTICFNPGSFNIINDTHKEIVKNYCDVLILNFEEAQAITGIDDINSILDVLENYVEILALTLGKDGCIVSKKGKRVRIPAPKVKKVVDTTGAGDAFAAGFIKGLLNYSDIKKSAELGHRVAREVIQSFGGR